MAKQFVRQHEPLRVPRGWTEQDRALVIQMNRLLDEVYEVQGKFEQRLADLNEVQTEEGQELDELQEAQGEAEQRLDELDEAQEATEQRFEGIATSFFPISNGGDTEIPEIPQNSDYNDYLTQGTWQSGPIADVITCSNRPCDLSGKLCVWAINNGRLVGNWKYGGQIYYDINGNMYSRFISTDGNGATTYGGWIRFAGVHQIHYNGITWGKTVTVVMSNRLAILMLNAWTKVTVWLGGDYDIHVWVSTINSDNSITNFRKTASNTLTFGLASATGDDVTITRSGESITVTTAVNTTITIVG